MNVSKDLIRLAALGFILGMIIGDILVVAFTASEGISLAAPELIDEFGYVPAVIIQTLLSGVLGCICLGATIVYYNDEYSILAATCIHMVIAFLTLIPISNFLWWTGRVMEGNIVVLAMGICAYVMVWFSVYMSYRIQIQKINEALERRNSGKQ